MEFCHFPPCVALITKPFCESKKLSFFRTGMLLLTDSQLWWHNPVFLNNDENRNRWNSIEA